MRNHSRPQPQTRFQGISPEDVWADTRAQAHQKMPQPRRTEEVLKEEGNSRKGKALILGCLFFLVVMVAGIGLYVAFGRSGTDDGPEIVPIRRKKERLTNRTSEELARINAGSQSSEIEWGSEKSAGMKFKGSEKKETAEQQLEKVGKVDVEKDSEGNEVRFITEKRSGWNPKSWFGKKTKRKQIVNEENPNEAYKKNNGFKRFFGGKTYVRKTGKDKEAQESEAPAPADSGEPAKEKKASKWKFWKSNKNKKNKKKQQQPDSSGRRRLIQRLFLAEESF